MLGLYLGDGCIATHPRTYKLRIVLDARYPGIISECREAMRLVRDCDLDRIRLATRVGCYEVYTYWQHWPCVFPQHGNGLKHQRPITLAVWQRSVATAHPKALLRGLIHSDGCRVENWVQQRHYVYPRYFFNNESKDILQIFRDACDALGIRYRNTRPNAISVARREDVAALDAFIGSKA